MELEVKAPTLSENYKIEKGEDNKAVEAIKLKKHKKDIVKPKNYLDERRIAEIFKNYSSPEG